MKKIRAEIHTEYIKLDSLLKLAGVYPTGGQAKERIAAGDILVNGSPCRMRGKKLRPGDRAQADDTEIEVVGA